MNMHCPKPYTRNFAFLAYLLLVPTLPGTFGHEGEHPPVAAAKPASVYAPSVVPDRINLTWAEDPATTQSVTWRTSTEVNHGMAQIAIAEAGPAFPTKAATVHAKAELLESDLSRAHYHSLTFRDLKPGIKYAYRVGDGTNWSEWFQFTTMSREVKPFSFIYFGDAQNDIRSMWSRVIREAYSDAPKASFLLHAGDLVNNAETDAQWGEWFGAGNWLNAMIPSVSIPGNHEMARGKLSHHWRKVFTLPENGPKGLEETCFTFVYQNTRIIGLNSNEQIDIQTKWLDKVLAENKERWVVCTFHHPVFSTAKDRDNPVIRTAWKPLLDKYRVDLVLQGHDHSYGRTGIKTPAVLETIGNVPTGVNQLSESTVYVVSVSGPKMYNLNSSEVMVRSAEDTQLYQIIHINGDSLVYEARTAVGDIYDAFELKKRTGKSNELIELPPQVAERRRNPVTAPSTEAPVSAAASTGKK